MEPGQFDIIRISEKNADRFLPLLPEGSEALLRSGARTALGLIWQKRACGAMCFADGEDCLLLLHICVAPDCRRRYFARLLISQLTNRAQAAGLRVEAAVSGENEAALAFLRDSGFELEQGGAVVRFRLGDFIESASAIGKPPTDVFPLGDVPEKLLSTFYSRLKLRGKLFIDGETLGEVSKTLSLIALHDKRPRSCLLVSDDGDDGLRVPFLYLDPAGSSADLRRLLRCGAYFASRSGLPPDTPVRADCLEEHLASFLSKLLSDRASATRCYTAVYR